MNSTTFIKGVTSLVFALAAFLGLHFGIKIDDPNSVGVLTYIGTAIGGLLGAYLGHLLHLAPPPTDTTATS